MNSDKFPNSIEEVVFQSGQFACVSNGAYYNVELTDFTKENVKAAYKEYKIGGDVLYEALFFTRGTFNKKFLFTDSVGHNFYK